MYVIAEVLVRITLSPLQNEVAPEAEITGGPPVIPDEIVMDLDAVQPLLSVITTV